VVFICIIMSFSFLKVGSYFYNQKDYVNATKCYKLSKLVLPFWELPKKRLLAIDQINELKKQLEERKNRKITVNNDDVTVVGKKISHFTCYRCPEISVTAVFKNKLDIGIPTIQVSKINFLKDGKIVAFKKLSKEFFIVSGGEFPFKITFPRDEQIPSFDDFQLEFQIPPFILDTNVIRLRIVDTKTDSVLAHTNNAVYLKYKVIILNDSKCSVNNVYRIAFLKYGDYIFDEYQSTARIFVKEESIKSDVIDLDNKGNDNYQRLTLKSGEQKEIGISLMIDSMYKGLYNLDDVRLENYFIGVKDKDCVL
jgi:hypothetical protein